MEDEARVHGQSGVDFAATEVKGRGGGQGEVSGGALSQEGVPVLVRRGGRGGQSRGDLGRGERGVLLLQQRGHSRHVRGGHARAGRQREARP